MRRKVNVRVFKRNILILIENLKITKKAFCEQIGYSRTAFEMFIAKESQPGIMLAIKISRTFDVNLNWLLLDIGDMFLTESPGESKIKDDIVNYHSINDLLNAIQEAKYLPTAKQKALAKYIEGQIILLQNT